MAFMTPHHVEACFASRDALAEALYCGEAKAWNWGEAWRELALLCWKQPRLAALVSELYWEHQQFDVSPQAVPTSSHELNGVQLSWLEVAFSVVHAQLSQDQALERALGPLSDWALRGARGLSETLVRLSHEALDELRQSLSEHAQLQHLFLWLGRLLDGRKQGSSWAVSAERVGLSRGDDLREVLPSEMALLSSPETEDLFWARYVSRQLLMFEPGQAEGGQKGGRRAGPVIVCLDSSASMQRELEAQCKALTLALVRALKHRRVEVLLFGGVGAQRWFHFQKGRIEAEALLEFATSSFARSTDLDGALREGLRALEKVSMAQADLVVLSDGKAHVQAETYRALSRKQGEGVRLAVITPQRPTEQAGEALAGLGDLEGRLYEGNFEFLRGDWAGFWA